MPVATPMFGYPGLLAVVKETTWGTAVSPRTNWIRPLSVNMGRQLEIAAVPVFLGGDATSVNGRGPVLQRDACGGTIELAMAYDDTTLFFLEQMFGAVTDGGGGGPSYTHTYKLALPANRLVGFTMEVTRGRYGSTVEAEVFEGCKVSKGVIRIPGTGVCTLTLDIIAQTSASRTTQASPTLHTGEPSWMMGHHCGGFAWGSLDDTFDALSLTIDHNLQRRWESGSLYTAEPLPGPVDNRLVTVDVDVERNYDDEGATVYTAHKALTQQDGTLTLTGASPFVAAFSFHNAVCERYQDPTTTPGLVKQRFGLRCYTDGTDYGAALVLTNSQSSNGAN